MKISHEKWLEDKLSVMSESDLAFIKSFCDRFVPVKVELDLTKGKHSKVPVISKWTSVTPEQSAALSAGPWRHFMFVVGEEAGLFVIDLDRKNEQRADHAGKVDGIEFFEDWCGPVEARDTFTSRTIGGGCHKVYRYTPELDGKLKSGQLTPLALCDILFNGRGFTFGAGYEIINRVQPQEPPKSVINFIVNNAQQTVVNLGNVQQQTNVQQNVIAGALGVTAATSLSDRINQVIGANNMTWRVNNFDDAAYQLIPNTRECCVQPGYHHTTDSHSCLYVRKTALIGKRPADHIFF